MDEKVIGVPQVGDYFIPAKFFLERVYNYKVLDVPNITNKTLELGSKYSPEFVCMPFKYTLGTMIESLNLGANIIIQLGGGCKYGYYGELQEKILRELGYNFTFINFISCGKVNIKKIIKESKKISSKLHPFKSIYYLFITFNMIRYMDRIDDYIRRNIGFEVNKGEFLKLKKKMLEDFSNCNNYLSLRKLYKFYKKEFKNILINKPENCIKIGIIGELYTIMEPFANYELESFLAQNNIEITRFTNAWYLLIEKKFKLKKYLKNVKSYIKYKMGADASDNIARTYLMCKEKYDGIIHIKSSFCTPEITSQVIIDKICKEYNMPIIYFSFDSNTSEIGIKTRLEAFYDMILMRRNR